MSLLEDVKMLIKKIRKHSLKVPENCFRAVTRIDPLSFFFFKRLIKSSTRIPLDTAGKPPDKLREETRRYNRELPPPHSDQSECGPYKRISRNHTHLADTIYI